MSKDPAGDYAKKMNAKRAKTGRPNTAKEMDKLGRMLSKKPKKKKK